MWKRILKYNLSRMYKNYKKKQDNRYEIKKRVIIMLIVLFVSIFLVTVVVVLSLALCKAAGKEDELYYKDEEIIKNGNIDK